MLPLRGTRAACSRYSVIRTNVRANLALAASSVLRPRQQPRQVQLGRVGRVLEAVGDRRLAQPVFGAQVLLDGALELPAGALQLPRHRGLVLAEQSADLG